RRRGDQSGSGIGLATTPFNPRANCQDRRSIHEKVISVTGTTSWFQQVPSTRLVLVVPSPKPREAKQNGISMTASTSTGDPSRVAGRNSHRFRSSIAAIEFGLDPLIAVMERPSRFISHFQSH